MKRISLISVAIVIGSLIACSLTSCKKKEGEYTPEKGKGRISKVYYEHYGVYVNSGQKFTTVPKKLVEVWKWDKNKLMQIESKNEYGQKWALNFIYKGKQVTKIESGDMVFNFTYTEKDTKLKKIEILNEEAKPQLNITIDDRSGDKVSKLTYEYFTYIDVPEKSLVSKMRPVMNIMLGDNLGEVVLKDVENTAKTHKATKTEKTTVQVVLTYNGNNVSEEARTIFKEGATTQTQTARYAHDNKSNPYYHAFCMIFDGYYNTTAQNPGMNAYFASFSENNIMSYVVCQPTINNPKKVEDTIDIAEYFYKYNGDNFPTERDKVKFIPDKYGDSSRNQTEHIIYYYEYVPKK